MRVVDFQAEDNNMLFMPMANRYREGKQVYKFASLQIYIEKSVVFVMKNTTLWEPISLESLVAKAKLAEV